jgi:hypothetical protein
VLRETRVIWARPSTSLEKGCCRFTNRRDDSGRAVRSQPTETKAGGLRLVNQHRCNRSMKRTLCSPRLPGVAHSSPRESGWAQTDALYLISRQTLSRVKKLQRRLSLHVHGAIGTPNAGDSTSLRARAEISQLIRKRDRVASSGAVPTSSPYGGALVSYVRYRTHGGRDL